MKTFQVLLTALLLAACSKAPPALVNQTPAQQELAQNQTDQQMLSAATPQPREPAQTSVKADSGDLDAKTAAIPQFKSPDAVAGAQAYAAALAQLKNQPTPPPSIGQDALTNPGSITALANQIATKLGALTRARQQVEANLAPAERAQWKAFQKSLAGEIEGN